MNAFLHCIPVVPFHERGNPASVLSVYDFDERFEDMQ